VVVAGVEYEVDCIIYASGFEVGTSQTRRNGYDVTGRDGVKLSEHWAEGMRTLHGLQVHRFPNLFIVQLSQAAALISNVPHNFTEGGLNIAAVVQHTVEGGFATVEPTAEAEEAWVRHIVSGMGANVLANADCTPGYYNNEGQPFAPGSEFLVGYPGGAMAYFMHMQQWRSTGEFEGLEFR
jgi:cyclohexanone monooxygenase